MKLNTLKELNPIVERLITATTKDTEKTEIQAAHALAVAIVTRMQLANEKAEADTYLSLLEGLVAEGYDTPHLRILRHEPEGSIIVSRVFGQNHVGSEEMTLDGILQNARAVLQSGADAILAHMFKHRIRRNTRAAA